MSSKVLKLAHFPLTTIYYAELLKRYGGEASTPLAETHFDQGHTYSQEIDLGVPTHASIDLALEDQEQLADFLGNSAALTTAELLVEELEAEMITLLPDGLSNHRQAISQERRDAPAALEDEHQLTGLHKNSATEASRVLSVGKVGSELRELPDTNSKEERAERTGDAEYGKGVGKEIR